MRYTTTMWQTGNNTAIRTVEVPDDLARALADVPGAREAFDALAPSKRKAHIVQVEALKGAESRARRVASIVESVSGE